MKFGIALHAHWSGETDQAGVYRNVIDNMMAADRLGYDSVWTTEHHFANDPAYRPFGWEEANFPAYDLAPDPLTLLTYGAAMTKNIRLGTGVLMINYDNPIRIAERAAMLDQLSGGRLELGIGRGAQQPHSAVFGVPTDEVEGQERFREALQIILQAWTGEEFEFHGKHFDFGKLRLCPTPLQRPYQHTNATGIPLYTSTQNNENLVEAARLSLSHATVTGAWGANGIERYNEKQEFFQNAAREHGIDPSKHSYPGHLFMFCAPTDAEAEEAAEKYILRFVAHVEAHYQRQRNGGYVLGPSFTSQNATLEEVKAAIWKGFSTNLIGSPNTVAEKLRAFLDLVPSINDIGAIPDAGTPPVAFVTRSMELFAREVIPKFADYRAHTGGSDNHLGIRPALGRQAAPAPVEDPVVGL